MKQIYTLSSLGVIIIAICNACVQKEPCEAQDVLRFYRDTFYIVDKDSNSIYYQQSVVKVFSETENHQYPPCDRSRGGLGTPSCNVQQCRFENLLSRKIYLPDVIFPTTPINPNEQGIRLDSLGAASKKMRDCEKEYYIWANPNPTIVYP